MQKSLKKKNLLKKNFEQLYTGYLNETENGYEVSNSINNFINTKKIISKIYNIDN